VHLAAQPDPAEPSRGRGQSCQHLLRRQPPQLRVLLGPAWPRGLEGIALLGARHHPAVARVERQPLDRRGADVEAGDYHRTAPSASYTSSYARTASLRSCASRSAASSIRAAVSSMKRHCSTERLTAAT